ncbi:MAG: transglutaminase N-terminal domain-containing protein [Methylococcales bacterium]|nr:transglutaminase N-terminal domain-containing protein [Methylococcales bacterium]MDD5631614.1 transglutaminase N-terminal domain-containing protein [Methylococcales bacterium]
MRRLLIKHVTNYQYAEAVTLLPHKLLLRPLEGRLLRLRSCRFSDAE